VQHPIEEDHTGAAGALGTHYPAIASCSDDTGYALYGPREARQTAELLLLSVHCTLWSVIRTSASCRHTSSPALRCTMTSLYPTLLR